MHVDADLVGLAAEEATGQVRLSRADVVRILITGEAEETCRRMQDLCARAQRGLRAWTNVPSVSSFLTQQKLNVRAATTSPAGPTRSAEVVQLRQL